LAFSGHLVVLSVFDPSIGMVLVILKYQFAKHPLFSRVSIDRTLVLSLKEVELVNRQEMESLESLIQKLVSPVHQ
jgi:hypothetical protein